MDAGEREEKREGGGRGGGGRGGEEEEGRRNRISSIPHSLPTSCTAISIGRPMFH